MSNSGQNLEIQKNVAKGDWRSGFACLCKSALPIHSQNKIRRIILAPIKYNKKLRNFLTG